MKSCEKEVKVCFGETAAYSEYQNKTANYSKDKWQEVNDGLVSVLAKFTECMQNGNTVYSVEAHALVKELQNYKPKIFTPAQTKFLQVWALCMLPMNASKTTLISTLSVRQSL